MANPWTGEVALTIDGKQRVLKLTLGALAELEQELQAPDLWWNWCSGSKGGAIFQQRCVGADRGRACGAAGRN